MKDVYPGYREELPGEFFLKRPYTETDLTRSYRVVDYNFVQEKHVVYTITGPDKKVTRRYSEFYLLREALVHTYVGLFVPPVPPKTFSVNSD